MCAAPCLRNLQGSQNHLLRLWTDRQWQNVHDDGAHWWINPRPLLTSSLRRYRSSQLVHRLGAVSVILWNLLRETAGSFEQPRSSRVPWRQKPASINRQFNRITLPYSAWHYERTTERNNLEGFWFNWRKRRKFEITRHYDDESEALWQTVQQDVLHWSCW